MRPPRCAGVGGVPVHTVRRWSDRERYSERWSCPVCGKVMLPRKDGRVRHHEAARVFPASGLVTQK